MSINDHKSNIVLSLCRLTVLIREANKQILLQFNRDKSETDLGRWMVGVNQAAQLHSQKILVLTG